MGRAGLDRREGPLDVVERAPAARTGDVLGFRHSHAGGLQDREARRVDLVLRDGSVAVFDPDAVAEAVEQQRSQVCGGLDLQRFGIVLVVRAADHDGIRLAFFDHFQKERPLLGHAVEVVGREQHDPSVGNRVDIGDAGLE